MQVNIEYLVLITNEGTFCSTEAAFNKLLQLDSRVTLKGDQLNFQDTTTNVKFTCRYHVTSGEVPDKPQRFFQMEFSAQVDDTKPDDDLLHFTDLLRAVRGVISKAHNDKSNAAPEVLWDDISAYYSKKAYPLVQEVENLMRKLISNFMLTRVGKGWTDENLPKETKDAIDKSKRKNLNNQLHSIDFIDLAGLLLTPYSSLPTDQLWKEVRKLKPEEVLTGSVLQNYLPRSNWQRYFAGLVECEDQHLEKQWKELYELRCKVAHNALFERLDYENVRRLTDDLRAILRTAIGKLPEVKVPKEEQERVAENAAASLDPMVGEFIRTWQTFEFILDVNVKKIGKKFSFGTQSMMPPAIIRALVEKKILTPDDYSTFINLMMIRNEIVHKSDSTLTEIQLRDATSILRALAVTIDRNCSKFLLEKATDSSTAQIEPTQP